MRISSPLITIGAEQGSFVMPNLSDLVETHFGWMLTHGYSQDTVRARRIAMRRFLRWCDAHRIQRPRSIKRKTLEEYQRDLHDYRQADGKPLALGTQQGFLAPLKTFMRWLKLEGYIRENPASDLKVPKQPKHLPRVLLSLREIDAIFTKSSAFDTAGLRDRAVLELLYATGIRRTEIANLAIYDIDSTRRRAFIRDGKGRRDRVVPTGTRAAAWIEEYLKRSRPRLLRHPCDSLFVTDTGRPATPPFIAKRVKQCMLAAGIKRTGATHLFRHACATHMLDNGADIRYIQELLGHARLETTQIYTHVAINQLQRVHAVTHPTGSARALRSRLRARRLVVNGPGTPQWFRGFSAM